MERERPAALEGIVTPESISGVGYVNGTFVQTDGTRLFATTKHKLALHLPWTGMQSTVAARRLRGRSSNIPYWSL